MKIELVKKPTDSDWRFVKECALVTIGKTPVADPDQLWKHNMLKARHSPIRELRFVFKFTNLPYWISVHLCRHTVGCQPYVRTQRNDRQAKYDRDGAPQDAPVDMIWSMNAEALMNIANKRLCKQAAKETRDVVHKMCKLVLAEYPEFEGLLVPACEYNGICHELVSCDA